jgi:uncharacterized membrane protein YccC
MLLSALRARSSVLLSIRAALCLTLPLGLGIATGHVHQAIIFAIGALWGVSQDGLDAWPVRSRRLLGLSLAALVGFGVGAAVGVWVHQSFARVVILGAAAGVSGYLQASGIVSFGVYGLLGLIVASGLATPGTAWWMPVAASLGALWVWAVAAAMDRRGRHQVLRECLADAFEALDAALGSIRHDGTVPARSSVLQALDVAQDAVGADRPRRAIAEGVAIRQCMLVALRCGELVSYLSASPTGTVRIPELRALARALRTGTAARALDLLRRSDKGRAACEYPPAVVRAFEIPSADRAAAWSPHPVRGFRPTPRECARFALLLGACVAAGDAVAIATRGPHGFWLPMSVAFILRPDLGPVIPRAAARTAGTLIGVGVAGLVALLGNPPVALIALSCGMAALMPAATRRGHSYAVMTFTPIVFVFIAMLGNDRGLFLPRVVDTALAALLVLVVDTMAWTTAPSLRPAAHLARADAAVEAYLRCDPSTPLIDRAPIKRAAFRSIASAVASEAMAEREPAVLRRANPAVRKRLNELMTLLDHHTVGLVEADFQ